MRKGQKPDLWTLLTDGLLLFLALISTAFGVVTAYRMEVISSALWVGAAVITPVTLALAHPRKYNILYLLSAFALWLWGLWRLWEPLVWGGTRLQCDVVNTISRKIPTVAGVAPVLELPGELWVQTATLWLLMVGCIYALVLALLLCALRRSTPVVLWMLLPILPALCVTEAPDVLPMLGMLSVWLTLALTSLTAHRDPAGTARVRPMALFCAALVLSLLAEKLPTQGTAQPLWAADLREAAINEASRGDLSSLLSRWSGWMGAGSTEYMNLLGGSPPHTGRVALRVETNQGGKHYLRGYSADVYTGRRWEPMDRKARKELETILETGVEPLLMLGENSQVQRLYYSSGFSEIRNQRSVMTVENVAAPGGCVYYPYALASLPENAQFGGDSHLERTGPVWEHTLSFYSEWENADILYHSYSIANYRGRTGAEKSGEEDPYRDFVYAHDLQVPQDLRPILEKWLRERLNGPEGETLGLPEVPENISVFSPEDFARYVLAKYKWAERIWEQWLAESEEKRQRGWDADALDELWWERYNSGGPTREDMDAVELTDEQLETLRGTYLSCMLQLVTEGLAQTTRYDRDTPAPPAGRDYVDWFLNESRQGYCMHYATAATLLLRTAGIPARYVSGYVAYTPYRMAVTEVTDYAAHAWVEVYIDGTGWYPLEATPGYQGGGMGDIMDLEAGDKAPGASPSAAPSPTPTVSQSVDEGDDEEEEEENDAVPSAAPTPSVGPDAPGGLAAAPGVGPVPSGVWYALGLLLLLALALWGRSRLLKRRRERLRGRNTNEAVLYAYSCHRRLGPWGGEENEELTALAEKARFSQHILTGAERERAAELFEKEASRVQNGLPGWKRPLFRALWGKVS